MSIANVARQHQNGSYKDAGSAKQVHLPSPTVPILSPIIPHYWLSSKPNSVAAKELRLSYHNTNNILFTIYPCLGNLN